MNILYQKLWLDTEKLALNLHWMKNELRYGKNINLNVKIFTYKTIAGHSYILTWIQNVRPLVATILEFANP